MTVPFIFCGYDIICKSGSIGEKNENFLFKVSSTFSKVARWMGEQPSSLVATSEMLLNELFFL